MGEPHPCREPHPRKLRYGFGRMVWLWAYGFWAYGFGRMALGAWFWAYVFARMVLGVWFWGDGFGFMAVGLWFGFGRMAFGHMVLGV